MNTTQQIDRERLAGCLLACARDLLGVRDDGTTPDLGLDLAGDEGLRLGDYVMDSLGFVAWMAELEEHLEVPVTDFADSERTRTLGGLADAILQDADPARVHSFCERWTTSSVPQPAV